MNYEELVKALRHCVADQDGQIDCNGCPRFCTGIDCQNDIHTDAAAAIENLQLAVDALKRNNDSYAKAIIKLMREKRSQPHWVSVEDEIPEDGEWAIFTNGMVITVERLKHDAYNHFYPPSEWFNFEDATYWMPLPEPPQEVQE